MKIDYNILWFEDNRTSFDSKKQLVKEIVEDFGFNFPEPRNEIDGSNIESIDYEIYDLLIIDLNLAGIKGSILIDKIRHQKDVYTEVVFYSSDGEKAVRNALRDYEVDGVYCTARDSGEFEDKVKKIIKTTIKKVQDVNNIRGLIMAETSDMDEKMLDIIKIVIDKHSSDFHQPLIDKMFIDVASSVKEKNKKYEKYKTDSDIAKLLDEPILFDSSKKLAAIQHVIESFDGDIFLPYKENKFKDAYANEVAQPRNLFAHVTEVKIDGIKKIKHKSKKQEIIFDDVYCNNVRMALRKYSTILENIKKHLDTD